MNNTVDSNETTKTSELTADSFDLKGKDWGNVTLPENSGWATDNSKGLELGKSTTYGADTSEGQVFELEAWSGDASNIYTNFLGTNTDTVKVEFDLAGRSTSNTIGNNNGVEVLWQDKVIDTILPGTNTTMKHYSYDLSNSGNVDRFEIRAIDHNSVGAIIDNLKTTTSSSTVQSSDDKDVTFLSVSDFGEKDQLMATSPNLAGSKKDHYWTNYKLTPDNSLWGTDNKNSLVEIGTLNNYTNTNDKSLVIELESWANEPSNIFTNFIGNKGDDIHIDFDLSARQNASSDVNVLWNNEIIDTIKPGRTFNMKNYDYAFEATGNNDRFELRAVDHDSVGAVVTNLHSVVAVGVEQSGAAFL